MKIIINLLTLIFFASPALASISCPNITVNCQSQGGQLKCDQSGVPGGWALDTDRLSYNKTPGNYRPAGAWASNPKSGEPDAFACFYTPSGGFGGCESRTVIFIATRSDNYYAATGDNNWTTHPCDPDPEESFCAQGASCRANPK